MQLSTDLIHYINNKIMDKASSLKYSVADLAPNNEIELFNASSLIIGSGASDLSLYGDKKVNWAFRALHDALHLKTGLGFSHLEEIELGRIQASQFDGILADVIYCEVSMQAKYHLETGLFVLNQVLFTKAFLNNIR